VTASREAVAWVDGQLVAEAEVRINAWSPTFHYGYGVFDGARVYQTPQGPAAFRLPEHLRRLRASAALYPPLETAPWTEQELADAVVAVVRENGFESCYVRPVICLGTGDVGNDPSSGNLQTMILAIQWQGLLRAGGLSLGVSSWRRPGPAVLPRGAKSNGAYAGLMLAKAEAVRTGFDDALVLDEAGYVVEATGANLFLAFGRTLVSPGAAQGALPGITRETVCEFAADLSFEVETRAVELGEVYRADEAFLTGTGAEIRSISSVSGRPVAGGQPGPLTEEIADEYRRVVGGMNPARLDWLTLCGPGSDPSEDAVISAMPTSPA
jgi:branched-chain amino acid aminotransferase